METRIKASKEMRFEQIQHRISLYINAASGWLRQWGSWDDRAYRPSTTKPVPASTGLAARSQKLCRCRLIPNVVGIHHRHPHIGHLCFLFLLLLFFLLFFLFFNFDGLDHFAGFVSQLLRNPLWIEWAGDGHDSILLVVGYPQDLHFFFTKPRFRIQKEHRWESPLIHLMQ